MSSEDQDCTKKAAELREKGRVEESIIAARKATKTDPESANAW